MTVASSTSRSGPYNCNGATTVFNYGFRILDEGHLLVIKANADGVETELVLTTDYTVSGVGSPSGGSITTTTAYASGDTITILRNVPATQEVDLQNQGAFFAEVIEEALDKLTMTVQQVQEEVDRSVKVNASSSNTPDQLVEAINTAASAAASSAAAASASASAAATSLDNFDDRYLGAKSSDPSLDNDGNALQTGAIYWNTTDTKFRVWNGSAWQDGIPTSTIDLINYSVLATAGQTVFTVTGGYAGGVIFVYLNGALLAPSDYTANDGSTVTLVTAASLNDEFRVVGYRTTPIATVNEMPVGSVSLPGLSFVGDTDTGIYQPAANQIALSAGGLPSLVLSGRFANLGGTPSTETVGFQIAPGRTGDGISRIDLVSDTTYPTFGLRLTRNAGANGFTQLLHRGTGSLGLIAQDAGEIYFSTSNTVRLRVPATAAGLIFPATQAASSDANCLDDYEEGTWTPGMTFNNDATGITYSAQVGRYVKVGQIVWIFGQITLTNNGSGVGTAKITGLPFTCGSGRGVIPFGFWSNCSAIVGNIVGLVDASATTMSVAHSGAAASADLTDTNITNTANLLFAGVYRASE